MGGSHARNSFTSRAGTTTTTVLPRSQKAERKIKKEERSQKMIVSVALTHKKNKRGDLGVMRWARVCVCVCVPVSNSLT